MAQVPVVLEQGRG